LYISTHSRIEGFRGKRRRKRRRRRWWKRRWWKRRRRRVGKRVNNRGYIQLKDCEDDRRVLGFLKGISHFFIVVISVLYHRSPVLHFQLIKP
jgi:hypothetical protein